MAIVGFAGVTPMDARTAGPIVRVVRPVTPLEALIVALPCRSAVASPAEVIVATLGSEDAHETLLVRSSVDPSE